MRGLRRFCFGMTVLFMGWSGSPTWAQAPQSAPSSGYGGLNWPPSGVTVPDPYGGNYSVGTMPAPVYQPSASGVTPAQYQVPGPMGPPPAYPPGPMGMPGPGGSPVSQLNPYPGLDMYRYGYQQTINENGLWFNEKLNASRKYHASVELTVPVYAEPGGSTFGYEGINTDIGATDKIPLFYFSMPRTADFTGGTGGGTGGSGSSVVDIDLINRYFRPQTFDSMFRSTNSTGIKLNLGYENEDGSGVSVNAWWGGEGSRLFQQGAEATRNYTPMMNPFDDIAGNDPLYILQLSALNSSLSIDNGTGVAERIPFDTMFQMQFSQQAWGAGLQILRPAIAKSSWYQVRPVIGLRYIDINEAMNFRGIDSGAQYDIINYEDIDYIQEFETLFNVDYGSEIDTTEADAGFEGRPDATTFNDEDFVESPSNAYPLTFYPTNPYETRLSASVQSMAAGPEIGLRTDLGGGDNLKLTFLATAGLMANAETARLNGYGVYNHFVNRVDPDNNELTPDGGEIGTGVGGLTDEETYFEDKSNSTVVSPTLDLSVSLEFRLFEYLPLFRQLELLEDAKFRTSYGYLLIGNVARPQDSVSYVTYPVNPSLDPDRGAWSMQQWTFGIDWNY